MEYSISCGSFFRTTTFLFQFCSFHCREASAMPAFVKDTIVLSPLVSCVCCWSSAVVTLQDVIFLSAPPPNFIRGSISGNLRKVSHENQRKSSYLSMKGFQGESFSGENMDISQPWERPMVYLNSVGEFGSFSA